MISVAKAIENHEWGEFETWLDAYNVLLIQHHEVEALNSSVGSTPSFVQRGTPPGGRNDVDEARLSASSLILSRKPGAHERK